MQMLMLGPIAALFRRLQTTRIQPPVQLRGAFGLLGSPKWPFAFNTEGCAESFVAELCRLVREPLLKCVPLF